LNQRPLGKIPDMQKVAMIAATGLSLDIDEMHKAHKALRIDAAKRIIPRGYFTLITKCTAADPDHRPTAENLSDSLHEEVWKQYDGGLASGFADGFPGEDGKEAVVSLVGEVWKWQLVTGTCKRKKLHFRGFWRPEDAGWFNKWKDGVFDLYRSRKASKFYVITYDDGSLGKNMKAYEIPFLSEKQIDVVQIKFTEFMRQYGNWD